MTETETGERVAMLAGMAVGMLVVVLFVADGFVDLDAWFEDRWPFPMWTTAFPAFGFVGVMALWSWRLRDRLMWAVTTAMLPLATGTVAVRVTEPDVAWGNVLRGVSLGMILVIALVGVLAYARSFRELERFLFTEATSIAFFATIIGAGAYAAAEAFVDVPRLAYAWVPLFGLGAWLISSIVLTRKMT